MYIKPVLKSKEKEKRKRKKRKKELIDVEKYQKSPLILGPS